MHHQFKNKYNENVLNTVLHSLKKFNFEKWKCCINVTELMNESKDVTVYHKVNSHSTKKTRNEATVMKDTGKFGSFANGQHSTQ